MGMFKTKKRIAFCTLLGSFGLANTIKSNDSLQIKVGSQNKELKSRIEESPHLSNLGYRPSLFLQNGHVQTILTGLLTYNHKQIWPFLKTNREIFTLSDGGKIAIDSPKQDNPDNNKPLILIVPGLMSSTSDVYIRSLILKAEANGYDWKVINYRGIKLKLANGKPLFYDDLNNFTEPLRQILDQNDKSEKPRQIFLLGYSLGGGVLANLMTEEEFDKSSVAAVVCSQPALDFVKSMKNSDSVLGGFYSFSFLTSYKNHMTKTGSVNILRDTFNNKMKDNKDYTTDLFDKIWSSNKQVEVQEGILKPLLGIDSLEEAQKRVSAINRLDRIKQTPVFVLVAENDPLTRGTYDDDIVEQSSQVVLGKTKYGGHLGFFADLGSKEQFSNEAIIGFFNTFKI